MIRKALREFFQEKSNENRNKFHKILSASMWDMDLLFIYRRSLVYAQYYQINFFQSPFNSSSFLHPLRPTAAIKSSWMYSDFFALPSPLWLCIENDKNELMLRVCTWQQTNLSFEWNAFFSSIYFLLSTFETRTASCK